MLIELCAGYPQRLTGVIGHPVTWIGGLIAALREGLIARDVETDREQLKADLAAGTLRLIGVTDFQGAEIRPAAVDEIDFVAAPAPEVRLPGPDSACPPLAPIALEDLAA